jgi:hypothetical protein
VDADDPVAVFNDAYWRGFQRAVAMKNAEIDETSSLLFNRAYDAYALLDALLKDYNTLAAQADELSRRLLEAHNGK